MCKVIGVGEYYLNNIYKGEKKFEKKAFEGGPKVNINLLTDSRHRIKRITFSLVKSVAKSHQAKNLVEELCPNIEIKEIRDFNKEDVMAWSEATGPGGWKPKYRCMTDDFYLEISNSGRIEIYREI